ncbi:MAG: TraE/TraK family type IV conjugative transfer system protein [Nitrospirota bacterium]
MTLPTQYTIELTGNVTSLFYIKKITLYKDKSQIEVTGLKREYSEDHKTEDGMKTYIIDYRFSNGKFMITRISEKEVDNVS